MTVTALSIEELALASTSIMCCLSYIFSLSVQICENFISSYNHRKHIRRVFLSKLPSFHDFFLLLIIFNDDFNCANNSASNCDGKVEFGRSTIIHFTDDRNSWIGKLATGFVISNNARLNQKI